MIDTERLRRVAPLARGRRCRERQPRRTPVRARLVARRGPRARPALRTGPALHRREARGRLAARVHARSADARHLATTTDKLLVWDVARGELRETAARARRGPVWGLQISADGRTLYSAGDDERALVWDLAGDRRLIRPLRRRRRRSSSIPATGRRAASRSAPTVAPSPSRRPTARVDLIDAQTLRRRRSVRALDGFAAAVAFSPDGHLLAVAGKGGQVTLWDARSLRPAGELSGLSTTSQALAFSPDGEPARRRRARHADRQPASRQRHQRARVGRAPARPHRRALRGDVGLARLQPRRHAARRRRASRAPPRSATHATAGSSRGFATPDGGRSLAFSPDGTRLATGAHGRHGAAVVDAQLEAGRAPLRGPRRAAVPVDAIHPRRPGARHLRRRRDGSAARRQHREPDRNGPHGRTRHVTPPPSSPPTARDCSRSPTGMAASAWTSPRRPGSDTPASSRVATSHRASGRTRCPASPTEPSAGPTDGTAPASVNEQ